MIIKLQPIFYKKKNIKKNNSGTVLILSFDIGQQFLIQCLHGLSFE